MEGRAVDSTLQLTTEHRSFTGQNKNVPWLGQFVNLYVERKVVNRKADNSAWFSELPPGRDSKPLEKRRSVSLETHDPWKSLGFCRVISGSSGQNNVPCGPVRALLFSCPFGASNLPAQPSMGPGYSGQTRGRVLSPAQKKKCPGTAFAVGTLVPCSLSSDITDSEKEGEASFSRGVRVLHPGRSGGRVRRPDTYQSPLVG